MPRQRRERERERVALGLRLERGECTVQQLPGKHRGRVARCICWEMNPRHSRLVTVGEGPAPQLPGGRRLGEGRAPQLLG